VARPGHRTKGRQAPRLKSSLATADRSEWVNPSARMQFTYMSVPAMDALEYWQGRVDSPMFVYFITEGKDSTEYVKIGQAQDPFRRLLGLQTGNPRSLWLNAVLLASDELEGDLHELYKDYGTRGEWFGCGIGPALLALANGVMESQIAKHRARDSLASITNYGLLGMAFPSDYQREAA
jgi:hypothetical protein